MHRLLAESGLTLTRAIEITQSLETAAQSVQTLQGTLPLTRIPGTVTQPEVLKVRSTHPCFCYGKTNHAPAKCKFKDAKCHHCGKVGHIKPACCSLPKAADKAEQPARRRNVHCMQIDTDTIKTKEYILFNLPATQSPRPLTVTLKVDDQDLPMEIDTGTSLSLISDDTRKLLWPNKQLQPSTAKLKTYSSESLPIKGRMLVKVQYGQQDAKLPLLVVQGKGPSLLGKIGFKVCNLIGRKFIVYTAVHSKKYYKSIVEFLSTLNGYQAKIYVDSTATPRFFKARSVPYSMQPLYS